MVDILTYNRIAELSRRRSAANLAIGYLTIPPQNWMEDILLSNLRTIEFEEHPFGLFELRDAIGREIASQSSVVYDPDTEITVTGSASEAIFAAILSIVRAGDNAVILEPAFSIYAPTVILAGGSPRFVRVDFVTGEFDYDKFAESFDNRTRLLIVNNPHSPTGKVFTLSELEFIADVCSRWGTLVLSDEVFDRIIWGPTVHRSIASVPSMRGRTILIGDTGKKISLKGIKLGYAAGERSMTEQFRAHQQLITYRLPTSIERTFASILEVAPKAGYYEGLIQLLRNKQAQVAGALTGFNVPIHTSTSGYFILMETSSLAYEGSLEFSEDLIATYGVATLPGQAFYWRDSPYALEGKGFVRICFAKADKLIDSSTALLRFAGKKVRAVKGDK